MRRSLFVVIPLLLVLGGAFALAGGAERKNALEEGTYAGLKTCKKCHFKHYKTWKQAKHKDAFKALPDKYKTEAKCLECHTTGYGQPGGFVSIEKTKGLAGVQCEMCHGPGAKHAGYMKEHSKERDNKEVMAAGKKLIGGERGKTSCWLCHRNQSHSKHPKYEK